VTPDVIEFRTLSAYELVAFLDRAFPHVCIKEGESEIHAHRYAGARDLIDQLVQQVQDESENGTD